MMGRVTAREMKSWLWATVFIFVLPESAALAVICWFEINPAGPAGALIFFGTLAASTAVHFAWNARSARSARAAGLPGLWQQEQGPAVLAMHAPEAAEPDEPATLPPARPELHPDRLGRLSYRNLRFSHCYEFPRGDEATPLAAWPVWSPVCPPPLETMTLAQVLYRTLASVRTPFRRSRLVLPDYAIVRNVYDEVLAWALDWARSGLGASPLPIALSLGRFCENARAVREVLEQLREPGPAPAPGAPPPPRLLAAVERLILCGSQEAVAGADELARALAAGNAWLVVEDDCDDRPALKEVRECFDLLLGPDHLGQAAALIVTNTEEASLLSDLQTFSLLLSRPDEPDEDAADAVPGRAVAAVCRAAALCGSPPLKLALPLSAVAAAVVLFFLLANYRDVTSAHDLLEPWWLRLASLLGLGAIALGFVGARRGCEEVREMAVDVAIVAILAGLALSLTFLVSLLGPGAFKTGCLVVLALPGAGLLGLAVVAAVGLLADILWLCLSERALAGLSPLGLAKACRAYRVVIHVARHGVRLRLPGADGPELPLLLSGLVPFVAGALAAFPRLLPELRANLLEWIREKTDGRCDYPAAFLLLDDLLRTRSPLAAQCLELVARDCRRHWGDRSGFGRYDVPSYSVSLNALEYTARRLCYLTDLEELIVVR
jgi:hypothetical protein